MAEFPHCNSTTIHGPGACYYCDRFPHLQRARAESGQPFSSPQANGWSGNVAVRAGETHSHMGVEFVVGDVFPPDPQSFDAALVALRKDMACTRNFKRAWRCVRTFHDAGPCALEPRGWNLVARWRYR